MATQKHIISSKATTNKTKDEVEVQADYEYSRSNYYELVERGTEAIEMMLEVARESEHPRAFEVLGKLIKDVSDVNEKLINLQKSRKEVQKSDQPGGQPGSTTNNNLFVGSTTELQRMLQKDDIKDIDVESE